MREFCAPEPFFAPKLAPSIGSFAKQEVIFSRIDTPILEHFLRPNVGHTSGEYDLVLIVEEKWPPAFLLQLTPRSGSQFVRILCHFLQKCPPRAPDWSGYLKSIKIPFMRTTAMILKGIIAIVLMAAAFPLTRTIAMILLPSSSWPPLFAKMPPTAPRIGPDIKNQLKSMENQLKIN